MSYFSFAYGNETPLNYYRHNYVKPGGSVVEIKEKKVRSELHHKFYVIKNVMTDYKGHKYTEIKLYDNVRGFIHKDKKDLPSRSINSREWFQNLVKYGTLGNYISWLNQKDQE